MRWSDLVFYSPLNDQVLQIQMTFVRIFKKKLICKFRSLLILYSEFVLWKFRLFCFIHNFFVSSQIYVNFSKNFFLIYKIYLLVYIIFWSDPNLDDLIGSGSDQIGSDPAWSATLYTVRHKFIVQLCCFTTLPVLIWLISN